MTQNTNISANIPAVRLKGFTGEWENVELNNLLDYEQPTEYLVASTDYVKNGIPVLTAGKSFILGFTFEDTGIFYNLPVIIFDDFTTDCKYVTFPFKVKSSAMKMLQKRDDAVNLYFTYLAMQNIKFEITNHQRFWISEYSKIRIRIPDSTEQQAIASYFTNLDTLIKAKEQQLEKLRNLKKASLQKMFPAEGETTPAVRLKGFSGEWELKLLGECFFERDERSSVGDMISVTINNGIKKADELDRFVHIKDKSNYKVVKRGDIAYNTMRMWQGACGYSEYDGILSPAYTVAIPVDNMCSLFFSFLFKTQRLIHTFKSCSQGLTSDTWNLKFPFFAKIQVLAPSLPEQQAIASYFTNLDTLIKAKEQQLEKLKNIKQASLKKMFA